MPIHGRLKFWPCSSRGSRAATRKSAFAPPTARYGPERARTCRATVWISSERSIFPDRLTLERRLDGTGVYGRYPENLRTVPNSSTGSLDLVPSSRHPCRVCSNRPSLIFPVVLAPLPTRSGVTRTVQKPCFCSRMLYD